MTEKDPIHPLLRMTGSPAYLILFCKQLSTFRLHPSRPRHPIIPGVPASYVGSSNSNGSSVNYRLKSIWRSDRTPLKSESGKGSVIDFPWESSIFRGFFNQVMMQSPSSHRILGRIPCYVASCSLRVTNLDEWCRFPSVIGVRIFPSFLEFCRVPHNGTISIILGPSNCACARHAGRHVGLQALGAGVLVPEDLMTPIGLPQSLRSLPPCLSRGCTSSQSAMTRTRRNA